MRDPFVVTGTTADITGSSRDIGRAIAECFSARGPERRGQVDVSHSSA
jgi:NAD(P)-dependent dehydrogenase (short-subunit alcohol dehydrogenase family)